MPLRLPDEPLKFAPESYHAQRAAVALALLDGSEEARAARRTALAHDASASSRRLDAKLARQQCCREWLDELVLVCDGLREGDHFVRRLEYHRKPLDNGIGWGRRYAQAPWVPFAVGRKTRRSLSLQDAPRELRVVLGSDRLHDVDIVNCFACLAAALGDGFGFELPTLRWYMAHRELVLDRIMAVHGVDRDAAKALPTTLLHGGTYGGWRREHDVPPGACVPQLHALARELEALQLEVLRAMERADVPCLEASIYGNKASWIRTGRTDDREPHRALTRVERTMFAALLQSIEDMALRVLGASMRADGWTLVSPQFDGLLVEARPGGPHLEASLRRAEAALADASNGRLRLMLKEKPFYNVDLVPILHDLATAHHATLG